MQFHIRIANEEGDLNEFSSWGPSFARLSFWGLSFKGVSLWGLSLLEAFLLGTFLLAFGAFPFGGSAFGAFPSEGLNFHKGSRGRWKTFQNHHNLVEDVTQDA